MACGSCGGNSVPVRINRPVVSPYVATKVATNRLNAKRPAQRVAKFTPANNVDKYRG